MSDYVNFCKHMLLSTSSDLSLNETKSLKLALAEGVRADGRRLNESRELILNPITKPGVATVSLGRTFVSAITTARLSKPADNTPDQGGHSIYVFSSFPTKQSSVESFQTYLRLIWKSSKVLEDGSLCVKRGEKSWFLSTRVIIHDDDGGIFEAAFAAIVASLSSLRFPSFDSNTGALYPPSQQRVHKVAFSTKPLIVNIGYIGDKIIVDPTKEEQIISSRFAQFVIDEWGNVIYIDSNLPGNIPESWDLATKVAEKWRPPFFETMNIFKPELYSVGSPADFIGFEPEKVNIKENGINSNYSEIEVWRNGVSTVIKLDIFEDEIHIEHEEKKAVQSNDWLLSSLMPK